MQSIDDGYGLLSAQRALLGSVTSNLRAVTIAINNNKKIVKVCFFYDGEISEEDFDTANTAITEIISDFPPEYELEEHIERIDYPNPISINGRIAFRRKEKKFKAIKEER